MPAVMTIPELERFLAAEFPQAFYPESGLSIEAVWDGGCLVRQAFREFSLRPGGTISGPRNRRWRTPPRPIRSRQTGHSHPW
jgi:hypothetical protein